MKKIFTFLLSSAFLLANAQSYREKKAVQLDLRQQYLAAYEIWQELANEQMGENLYDANVLLNCAMDAYYTERCLPLESTRVLYQVFDLSKSMESIGTVDG